LSHRLLATASADRENVTAKQRLSPKVLSRPRALGGPAAVDLEKPAPMV
jgi:hypothetical protein